MHIEVQWQDVDSLAVKYFMQHYPDSQVMLCGGHVARAHTKRLGTDPVPLLPVCWY